MTEDNDMQRMTEAGNEYFADALTNMQPHYEDLVSRLTDSIRGLAIPRVEETLISPFDGSYAANNFIQQLERTSEGPQDDATLQARLRTLLKGDLSYKRNPEVKPEEQMITALPDVKVLELKPEEDEFVVLACDGIWNYMSSQQVVDFIRERLPLQKNHLSSICEELFDACLAPNTQGDGTGCDNMTCIIVRPKKQTSPSSPAAKRPKLE